MNVYRSLRLLTLPLVVIVLLGVVSLSAGCVTQKLNSEDAEARQDIEKANLNLAMLSELVANLPAYAEVTEVTAELVRVVVHGQGVYPLVVTLYGDDLEHGQIIATTRNFKISREYGENKVMAVFINPVDAWTDRSTVDFDISAITGEVHYATASTAKGR